MSTDPRTRAPSMTESRNTDGRIRGGPDDGSLPRVDRGAEDGLDPIVPARAPEEGGEVRVPDPPRAARPVQRVLRSQGGNPVSRVATSRGAGVRPEPMAGADERDASEVLPADGPRPDRAPGGIGRVGRDDPGRRARPCSPSPRCQSSSLGRRRYSRSRSRSSSSLRPRHGFYGSASLREPRPGSWPALREWSGGSPPLAP